MIFDEMQSDMDRKRRGRREREVGQRHNRGSSSSSSGSRRNRVKSRGISQGEASKRPVVRGRSEAAETYLGAREEKIIN